MAIVMDAKATNKLFVLFVAAALCVCITAAASAHSGRTDANGGHNCNVGSCAGTYHYHNGGSNYQSSNSYRIEGLTNGQNHAKREKASIESTSESAGSNAGYSAAITGEAEDYYPPAPDYICDTDFTFDAGTPQEYKTNYNSGWNLVCSDIADSKYRTAYALGYQQGAEDTEENNPANSTDSEETDSNNDWIPWVVIGGFYGLPILGAVGGSIWEKIRDY